MIDKFCYVITLLMMCFACVWVGWDIGYKDAKKKYKQ
jgi:hypothetical protein